MAAAGQGKGCKRMDGDQAQRREVIAGLVDLERYPIADLDSPQARGVIEEGRDQLARSGLCLFPGFVSIF